MTMEEGSSTSHSDCRKLERTSVSNHTELVKAHDAIVQPNSSAILYEGEDLHDEERPNNNSWGVFSLKM